LGLIPFDSFLAFARVPLDNGRIAFGHLRLENMIGFPPTGKANPAIIGATLYAKRFSLAFHYDPRVYTSSQAKEFLEGFARQIRFL
jgi:hypothetical protein